MDSPAIEAAVDDGIVHGGAHCKPQHGQVNLLDVLPLAQTLVETRRDEVDMIRQPAEGEGNHYNNHHLHHLQDKSHQQEGKSVGGPPPPEDILTFHRKAEKERHQ